MQWLRQALSNPAIALPLTMNTPQLFCTVLGGLPLFAASSLTVQAQTIAPATDGTGTQITVVGDRIDIHGGSLSGDGANLFHSFQEFGLTASQIANFLSQPGIEHILGRVVGSNPSVINGLLQVTGGSSNLYLMNPSGIILGAQAQLNVPGDFVATTATGIGLDSGTWFNAIGSPDYAALVGTPNQFAFDQLATGAIVNVGNLTVNAGNEILLLAGQTANTGNISAPDGRVTIAAVPGESLVRISQSGHLLSLEVDPPRTNTGELATITASDLPTLLTGSGINTGLTVMATGEIQADATGTVLPNTPETNLVSGTITAAEVNLLGDRVGLFAAQVDASGATGGGNVRIGGDYRGEGTIPNATNTTVDEHSQIQADAIDSGDGGRVIIWADNTTRFWGEITAQGVDNGGFVEVSGKQSLVFPNLENVNVSGRLGRAGTLLLDPENIVVGSVGTNDSSLPTIDANTGSGTFFISQTALNTALFSNNVTLAATNNITFESDYDYLGGTTTNSLILEADGNVNTGRLNLNGGASIISLDIDADGSINVTGEISTLGSISLEAGESINTATLSATESISLTAERQNIVVNGYIKAEGNDINLTSASTIQVQGDFGGISIDSGTTGGSGAINITHGGGLTGTPFIVGDASRNGTVGLITSGDFTIAASPQRLIKGSFNLGNISISTTGNSVNCSVSGCSGASILNPGTGNFVGEDVPPNTSGITPDAKHTNEIAEYFELGDTAIVAVEETQDFLRDVESATGVKSVILYVDYVPTELAQTTPESNTIAQAKTLIPPAQFTIPDVLWEFTTEGLSTPNISLVQQLSRIPQESDRLELILITPDEPPIRRPVAGITRNHIRSLSRQFQRNINRPSRGTAFLDSAQQLYNHIIAPIRPELERLEIDHIGFIADAGLRSLPFAALHNGERFLIEDFSVNLMPSVSLTDLKYTNIETAPVLAMGAATFTNQAPLPAVPLELTLISEQIRSGQAFLDQDFTIANLQRARRTQPFPIVHLAT
ncbi:MAG: CHAT domain-containing protein, partial [Spirulina sp. SIO3F2]|nr:CHAT domain-containing protein [Spirulina sp. SIO3F2]